ncbi:MAG: 6-carboxytetrahydropterin synthase [Vampirovibrionales bacterium]|nr:6-carboxytetrahydropterin synthase [Vampirovibrionales bacterium]
MSYQSPKLVLTRRYDFPASHRLANPLWDDARNQEVFGPCSHINGHGHNYTFWISVTGAPDAETGMIMNLSAMDALVQRQVLDWVDHRHLNLDVPFLAGQIPTTEVLAQAFWHQLSDHLPDGVSLLRIRVQESRNNAAEVTLAPLSPAFLME